LKAIAQSAAGASELAVFSQIRAIQKFDECLPSDMPSRARGHDYFDLPEAKRVAQQVPCEWPKI
jgi:hypothetical protein